MNLLRRSILPLILITAIALILVTLQPGRRNRFGSTRPAGNVDQTAQQKAHDVAAAAAIARAQAAAMASAKDDPTLTEEVKFDETVSFVDSIQMKMIEVRRTCSWVGFRGDPDGDSPERYITAGPFYLGETEVTRAQWRALYGDAADPSIYPPPTDAKSERDQLDLPVNNVTWSAAVKFCMDLSAREGRTYRLPTEDEWEVAAWARRRSDPNNSHDGDMAALAAQSLADIHYAKEFEDFLMGRIAPAKREAARRDYLRYLQRRPVRSKPDVALEAERRAQIASSQPALRASMQAAPGTQSAATTTSAATTALTKEAAEDPRSQFAVPPGFYAMLGNVAEWTSTRTAPSLISPGGRPIEAEDLPGDNPIAIDGTVSNCTWQPGDDDAGLASFDQMLAASGRHMIFYVVRGGSFDRTSQSCTPYNRWALPAFGVPPTLRANVGFRVAMDP